MQICIPYFRKSSWLFAAALAASALRAQTRPNIVFIFTDDHAAQAIPAYGGLLKEVAKTPNLDKLASQGMRFEHSYATNSLCGPSRAVVQTGKYSHLNGFKTNTDVFDMSQQTCPKILRRNGYQTAIIGKWHLVTDPQGFDYWDVPPDQGVYYNPQFIRGDSTGRKQARKVTGYNSDIVGDLALDWLRTGRDQAKPFLLMYQFKATHRTWEPGPLEVGMFANVRIPSPANLIDDYRYRGSAEHKQTLNIRDIMTQDDLKLTDPADLAGWLPDHQAKWNAYYGKVKKDFQDRGFTFTNRSDTAMLHWKYQRYMEDYLSTAYGMDRNVGRMLDFLDSAGLAKNTIVIYSSDQGFFLGEHGWFDKRFMFEESMRAPLIVRWPGVVKPGTVDKDDLVSNLDFPETFLEAAGVAVPGDMQGASLVPILRGQTPATWRKSFYYQYYEGPPAEHNVYRHYGVTTGRYKLIYFQDVDEWEFFDLKKDPSEMINQFFIPENAALIAQLKDELARLRRQLGVPADPPRAALPTVTLEKWTSVLPVKGCIDPKYAEYDPEATVSVPGACKLPTAMRAAVRGPLREVDISYVRGSGTVFFDATGSMGSAWSAGRAEVSIHKVDGSLLETLSGTGRFPWNVSQVKPGMYLVEIVLGGKRQFLKFRI